MSTQEQRDELRRKIEASEQRQAERTAADVAKDVAENATKFVKEHPLLTVGAVALIGLAIGSRTRPGRELTNRATGFVGHIADLGAAYASGLFDAAGDATRQGSDRLSDLGDDVAYGARSARRDARYFADRQRDAAMFAGRRAAKKAERKYRDVRSRLPY